MPERSLHVAMALGQNIGRCAKLLVKDVVGVDLVKRCALETDPDYFDPALKHARHYAESLLCGGDRHFGFEWCMEPCDGKGPLPDLEGDSCYGAFSMLFLQVLTQTLPEGVLFEAPAQVRCLIPAIRSVDLSTIAITAGPGPHGCFETVKGINEKFSCLAALTPQPVCVTARKQCEVAKEEQHVSDKVLQSIRVIEAHDAIDAFGRLFRRQSCSYVMATV